MTRIILAVLVILSATSFALAQSQRNWGPNGPGRSDCFGSPYGGAVVDRCPGDNGAGRHWYHRR